MCPHLRSAESRLRRRTMKRPRPQQSRHRGRLALSVVNRGLRCEFFSAGAEVGKVFGRAEIRKAAREVMSSSATNAPPSPRRSLCGPLLSPRNLTRPEILLPHSERRFIPHLGDRRRYWTAENLWSRPRCVVNGLPASSHCQDVLLPAAQSGANLAHRQHRIAVVEKIK